jgi:HEAT repeat protein
MVHALLTVLLASSLHAEEALFPPIGELLGEAHNELPRAEMLELRDSLNERPSEAAFMAAMRSKNPEQRLGMIRAMGDTADVRAIPYLAAVLMKMDEAVPVRVAAAVSLGRVKHPLTKGYLIQAARDPSQEVRFAALLGLGHSDESGVVTVLEERLRKDPSWWARYAAAISLGRARKAFTIGALALAAKEDGSWQVRMEAARALGEIKTNRAAEALEAPLADEDHGVRAVAAIALGENGAHSALRILKNAFYQEKDAFVKSLLSASIKKALAD